MTSLLPSYLLYGLYESAPTRFRALRASLSTIGPHRIRLSILMPTRVVSSTEFFPIEKDSRYIEWLTFLRDDHC